MGSGPLALWRNKVSTGAGGRATGLAAGIAVARVGLAPEDSLGAAMLHYSTDYVFDGRAARGRRGSAHFLGPARIARQR